MDRKEIIGILQQEKLVAIVRLKEPELAEKVIKSLVEGGVRALEITSNTPQYLEEIAKARRTFPKVLIGAGTITNSSMANDAIMAGAQFIVTPNTDQDIVKIAHRYSVPILMGALSPTEIGRAANYGADIIKLFPAGSMGIGYFKSIKGPYDDLVFFPVGGIGLDNIQDWLEAGAAGVGVGSVLVKALDGKESALDVKRTATKFIELIKGNS